MEKQTKIALVTGGSRGLGKSMALHLAKSGVDVILTYNSKKEEAESVVSDIRQMGRKAVAMQLNVGDLRSFDAFFEQLAVELKDRFGRNTFDFLINNAGMGATIPFTQVTEEVFDQFLNVHFKGVYFLTQKSLPLMADGGRIINISTGTTRFSNPGYSVYASMKGAVEVFTKYLAKELGGRGITANILAPGPIETDFNNAAIRSNPEMKSRLSSLSPLGRVGEADDIGGVVALLCSEQAGWINGQRIEASGGINL
ncbi:MAG TPA: SDR family oxidoreductase [Saprospiraceae bacterium]|nr:SDR family oxidoreductase [Saprospiraceae bacterium]